MSEFHVACTCCPHLYYYRELEEMTQLERWDFWLGNGCPTGRYLQAEVNDLTGDRNRPRPTPVKPSRLESMRINDLAVMSDTRAWFDSM